VISVKFHFPGEIFGRVFEGINSELKELAEFGLGGEAHSLIWIRGFNPISARLWVSNFFFHSSRLSTTLSER